MQTFKNIIFDFGGVIIDVDYHRCIKAFTELGFDDFGGWYSQFRQDHLFDDLETGKIPAAEFRNRIRQASPRPLTDEMIDAAWNAILLRLPPENVRTLQHLSKRHRLFLLSNTNAIHEAEFTRRIVEDFGSNILPSLFEGVYFSHRVGLRKPHPEIFHHVLSENGLAARETLFIDDSPQHVEGAEKCGLTAVLFRKGMKLDILV